MLLVVPFLFAVFPLWIILVSLLLQALVALLEALLLQLHLQMLHHPDPVAFGVFFLFLPSEQVPPVALLQNYLEQIGLELLLLYPLLASVQRCWVFVLNPMLWLVEAFFVLLWAVLGLRFGHHLGERRLAHGPDFVWVGVLDPMMMLLLIPKRQHIFLLDLIVV